MKLLGTTALTATLMAAAVPSLTSPAHAWWRGYGYHPVIRHHLYAAARMVDPCTYLHDAWAASTDPGSRAYFFGAGWQAGCSFATSFTPWGK
jgi:hypothetical protein